VGRESVAASERRRPRQRRRDAPFQKDRIGAADLVMINRVARRN
jgi:hypothetical protein